MCLLFILFLVQERKKLVELKLVSNLSEMPAAAAAAATATTPPHPLPGRQHLIKMARTLGPLPRRSVLGLEVGGGEASRLQWDSWQSDFQTTAKWILDH